MNPDLVRLISLYLSDQEMVSYSSCDKYLRNILENEDYYRYRFRNFIGDEKYTSYKDYGSVYIFIPRQLAATIDNDSIHRVRGVNALIFVRKLSPRVSSLGADPGQDK